MGREADDRDFALFGQEMNGTTHALCRMNMFLHGMDNFRIEWGDTLRNPARPARRHRTAEARSDAAPADGETASENHRYSIMKKDFSFYEFAGVIVPGSTLLLGIAVR